MDESIKNEIRALVKGEVFDDPETLKKYSTDASLFQVWPRLVIWPKDKEDIKRLVKFVAENKKENPKLSITVRAAGSCMSGGSLNESIILDVSKYFNKFEVNAEKQEAIVEPGVFYRDFEVETLKHDLILPCYTASKNLCALGGMIGNNAAGEKTLRYGKMENFVEELSVTLRDGEEYTFKPLSRVELLRKSHEHTVEGEVYERMARLIEKNREEVIAAKPRVSKNSAGYYLWNVERSGMFDLVKLLVGSQGTLGIITAAKIRLVPVEPVSRLLVVFMPSIEKLGEVVNKIMPSAPESIESYDDSTLKLALRYLPEMISLMKANFLKLLWSFLPEAKMVLTGGMPKLVLLVEFAGTSGEVLDQKVAKLKKEIEETYKFKTRATKKKSEEEKYWTIRRESFNLLRKHIRGRRTAPFVDDVCVEPQTLPKFLPRLRKILDEAKLTYTIAGHAGNGNFHVIPLMDMKDKHSRAIIPILSEKVYSLVKEFGGTITAEHNDGIVRTPYLNKMYSPEIIELFKQTKEIFDPENIFNPGKKVNGTVEYMVGHLAKD